MGGLRRISPDEVTIDYQHPLGSGCYGTVYRGRCRGAEVAVKVFKKQHLSDTERARLLSEIDIFR